MNRFIIGPSRSSQSIICNHKTSVTSKHETLRKNNVENWWNWWKVLSCQWRSHQLTSYQLPVTSYQSPGVESCSFSLHCNIHLHFIRSEKCKFEWQKRSSSSAAAPISSSITTYSSIEHSASAFLQSNFFTFILFIFFLLPLHYYCCGNVMISHSHC